MGTNKTLYIASAQDVEVIEAAAVLTGGKLSRLVCDLLREWVTRNDPDRTRTKSMLKMQPGKTRRLRQ